MLKRCHIHCLHIQTMHQRVNKQCCMKIILGENKMCWFCITWGECQRSSWWGVSESKDCFISQNDHANLAAIFAKRGNWSPYYVGTSQMIWAIQGDTVSHLISTADWVFAWFWKINSDSNYHQGSCSSHRNKDNNKSFSCDNNITIIIVIIKYYHYRNVFDTLLIHYNEVIWVLYNSAICQLPAVSAGKHNTTDDVTVYVLP